MDSKRYYCAKQDEVNWLLAPTDQHKYSLKSFPGYSILNPFFYFSEYYIQSKGTKSAQPAPPFGNYPVILTTGCLLFELSDEAVKDEFEISMQKVMKFLKYLKNTSLQYSLKEVPLLMSVEKIEYDEYDYEFNEVENRMVPWEKLYSYIQMETLAEADIRLCNRAPIYIHEDLFLQAIEDFSQQNISKSILGFAIAIESALRSTFDLKYEDLKKSNPEDNRFRIVELATQREKSKKDPIFEFLESRSNLKSLLHEIPLYLLGKSLFIENESLYQDVLKLAQLRNKLAHRGEIPEATLANTPFKLTPRGYHKALLTAANLFVWLGYSRFEKYVFPSDVAVLKKGDKEFIIDLITIENWD